MVKWHCASAAKTEGCEHRSELITHFFEFVFDRPLYDVVEMNFDKK